MKGFNDLLPSYLPTITREIDLIRRNGRLSPVLGCVCARACVYKGSDIERGEDAEGTSQSEFHGCTLDVCVCVYPVTGA